MARFSDFLLAEHRTLIRSLSAQAAVSFKPKNEDEFANAKPFDEIPGLSKVELMQRFMPGGQYDKMSIIDVFKRMRDELGDFHQMPGMFGQKTSLLTYDADVVEFVHRNEGTYPYRRSMETMAHYRKNVRSDIYSIGGLVVE